MTTKKLIFVGLALIIFLLNSSTIDASNKIYILDLNYDKGNFNLLDISVKQGYAPDRQIQPETGYKSEIVSFTNEVLYSFKFEIPLVIHLPPPRSDEEPGAQIYLDKVDFTLLIPYFENGESINIYDPSDVLMLSVDVSKFAEVYCGNTFCNSDENYYNCPQACEKKKDYLLYILAIVIVLIILGFIYKLFKKKEKFRI